MTTPPASSDIAILRKLPKVEMHLHLEGAMRANTAVELARKNGIVLPEAADPQDLYSFTDLPSFLKVYEAIAQGVRRADDFRRITYEMLQSCAESGARRIEFFASPLAHAGIDVGTQFEGIRSGIADARRDFGLSAAFSVGINRELGPAAGEELLDLILQHRTEDLIGIGLDYNEAPFPPAPYRALFERARAQGLHVSAHAGETGPADYVRDSIDLLKVERVDHGYRIVEDGSLLERCRTMGIMFTACPTNTLFTFAQISPSDPLHPMRRMREAGLVLSINSDDPPMLLTNLAEEYRIAMDLFGFSQRDIKQSILASVASSWLDESTKREWLRDWPGEIDTVFAGTPSEAL